METALYEAFFRHRFVSLRLDVFTLAKERFQNDAFQQKAWLFETVFESLRFHSRFR